MRTLMKPEVVHMSYCGTFLRWMRVKWTATLGWTHACISFGGVGRSGRTIIGLKLDPKSLMIGVRWWSSVRQHSLTIQPILAVEIYAHWHEKEPACALLKI